MKRILVILIALLLMPMVSAIGTQVGIDFETEDFAPRVWMCDNRKVIEDDIEYGRTSNPNEELIERHANYAFEGEKIYWDLLVMDKNKIEEIDDVYVTIGSRQRNGDERPEGCYGTPEADTCSNYDYEQCMEIEGCELVCDIYVDDDGICDGNSPCYTIIQDAIDDATSGEVICVADGTYDGFDANKEGITVRVSSTATISGTGVSADGHTVGILISAHNIIVDGFTVDGPYSTGIYVYDASTPPQSATIKNCIVDLTGYDATSYGTWDAAAVMAKPGVGTITIEGNTLIFGDASYATNPPRASNGIKAFCGQGPDYIIRDNTIIITKYGKYAVGINYGSGDDGSDEASASVLIEGNEVYAPGCDGTNWDKVFGIWLYGGSGAYVNNAVVQNNNVHNTNYALWVSGPNVDDTTVTGNNLMDSGFGFVVEDSVSGSLDINNNNIYGNSNKGGYSDGTQNVDAEANWWGTSSGPTHSGNPGGTGDAVSDNVDYDPFENNQLDIPAYTPAEFPICQGTPVSCEIIHSYSKCRYETNGCYWLSEDGQIEAECLRINGVTGSGCYGKPKEDVCKNYDYEQCIDISDCNLVCDRFVDQDTVRNCDGNTPCDSTIQAALDPTSDNEVICVYDGTYEPFIVDGKNGLIIRAIGAVTVEGVQSVATAYTNRDSVIFVDDSTNIVLDSLDIQGNALGTINQKSYGVIYESSSGAIRNCIVSPNTIDNMYGSGIGIWDSSDVSVEASQINNFGRIGIFAYNDCNVDIFGNEVECQVYADEGKVCYGIEVEAAYGSSDPSTASQVAISFNEIYNCDNTYPTGPTWDSGGIYINGWLEYMDEADSTVIIENNDIHDNYEGIIAVKSPSSYAHSNNIYNNRAYGVNSIDAYDATNAIFDAEDNWWGASSGPTHSGNPGGTGDAASDNVDYEPFENNQLDIPDYTATELPICRGTPASCQEIDSKYKCDYETPGCAWFNMESCNARIDEEDIDEFNDQTMAAYSCLFTVETPDSMDGPFWVTVEAIDSTGLSAAMDENEYWFFNPVIALSVDSDVSNGGLNFGTIRPGTVAYSNTILVGNDADEGSGVLLDMFISGKDFYDPDSDGSRCAITNRLKLGDNYAASGESSNNNKCEIGFGDTDDHFCYYATNGAYSTEDDLRSDAEGYAPIVYGNAFARDLYNDAEIIQANLMPPYWGANILGPGAEIALTFKLGLPLPCVGDFTDGDIYFWGEAI